MSMMQNTIEPEGRPVNVSPILLNMLSTSIGWLVNAQELNRAVEDDLKRIDSLSRMSDAELAEMGITRDQITAYVLQEMVEDED